MCKYAFGDTVNAICNEEGYGGLQRSFGDFRNAGYWSSSEGGDYFGMWSQGFGFGVQSLDPKDLLYYVRPVRAF